MRATKLASPHSTTQRRAPRMAQADMHTSEKAASLEHEHEHERHEPARDSIGTLAAALFPALEDLPRVPQQARSREKRNEILKAAARMFVEHGYAGTTTDDIAEAAGVSVGTFYNYFRNKRQVLIALVLERLEDIFSNIQLAQMDFTTGNHDETIRRAITAVLASNQSSLRRVWLELMSQNPDLVPYQQFIRRHVLTQLEANLRRAKEHGETWPDLDVEAAALAIFTLLDSMSMRRDDTLSTERVIEALTQMVYRTLFPPRPEPAALPTVPPTL